MKKVLILVNKYTTVYNFRKEVVLKLLDENFEVFIASPYDDKLKYFEDLGVKVFDTKIDKRGISPFEGLRLIRTYKKLIKNIKPDVVLTYTIKPNIYGAIAASQMKVPYIANITGLGTAVENKGILQKLTTFLYKYSFRKINTVFFQNESNMNYFKENRIALEKHKLIPGSGVNLTEFKYTKYPNDNIIKFIFISRIMKEKGIEYYLHSAKKFKIKYGNKVEFHIYGFSEKSYEGNLEEFIDKNYVVFKGLTNNVSKALVDKHAIIHPTYYPEGMSNVLLEAAATGRVIITTNRPGTREIVDDGVNGFLIDIKNQNN